jgi:hypothetical protein
LHEWLSHSSSGPGRVALNHDKEKPEHEEIAVTTLLALAPQTAIADNPQRAASGHRKSSITTTTPKKPADTCRDCGTVVGVAPRGSTRARAGPWAIGRRRGRRRPDRQPVRQGRRQEDRDDRGRAVARLWARGERGPKRMSAKEVWVTR